jgi:hypothetical protein
MIIKKISIVYVLIKEEQIPCQKKMAFFGKFSRFFEMIP